MVIDDWPMSLEATRAELQKARKQLERYQAVLRLANVEIEQRNRYIFALMTFAHRASRAARLNTVLKLALVQALETVGTPVGAVILIEPDTKELSLGVHKGLAPQLIDILTGKVLDDGAMALMPHLATGDGALLEYETADDSRERLLLTNSHLTSLVSLPLQVDARLRGTLIVGLQGKKMFKPSELCFLMALSQETTVFLDSLHLREELWHTAETVLGEETAGPKLQEIDPDELNLEVAPLLGLPVTNLAGPQATEDDLEQLLAAMMEAENEVQQQNADLQTLNTIGQMMNRTLDLKEFLQYVVDQTQLTLKTDAAWLYLVDEKQQLGLRTHTGLSETYVRGMQCLPQGVGLEGQVAAENKARFIEDISADAQGYKIWVDKEGLQALAAVPLTCPGTEQKADEPISEVVGVLAVGIRARPDATSERPSLENGSTWSPREIRLLTSIANQVGLAIYNANLYARLQDSEVNVRTGNEVLRTINDMLLEKNAYLEGFIRDDLTSTLNTAAQALQYLQTEGSTTLTEGQKQNITILQKLISRLSTLAREASGV
ncbi:MAG: GAF domain-containing protein, partial [Chloroflexota bacterium]